MVDLTPEQKRSQTYELERAVVDAAMAWHVYQTKMSLGLVRAACFALAKAREKAND